MRESPFTPQDAAQRLPLDQWQPTLQHGSHGNDLLRYVAELELPPYYGPERPIRLIAASADPATLKPDATWYMTTTLPLSEASTIQVYELYCLRDWIEHYYKPVKHELGWADFQVRPARAIVRHGQLVMLAYTFCLLQEALPPPEAVRSPAKPTRSGRGGKITGPPHLVGQPPCSARLAVSLGPPPDLLAAVVQRAATTRVGSTPAACRAVSSLASPNLTNQRVAGESPGHPQPHG